ncbi:hypothetical protein URS_0749 [Acinetobacter ursingii]|nr:hypothetical protein URS_0749 [Acinetobacter ursingii]
MFAPHIDARIECKMLAFLSFEYFFSFHFIHRFLCQRVKKAIKLMAFCTISSFNR